MREVECAKCVHFENVSLYNCPCDDCHGKKFKSKENEKEKIMTDDKKEDYKILGDTCTSAVYGVLVQLNASKVVKEDINIVLETIGKAFITMSIGDKSIDDYIKHYEEFIQKGQQAE